MLQNIRERLVLILIGLLPLHAFLVTVGTKMITGPGHSPLPILAIWKEALLGLVLLTALMEWAMEQKKENIKIDLFDGIIGGLLLIALAQYFVFHLPESASHFVYGFKYDFLPLIAFLVLRRVSWSPWFNRTAAAVLLGVGAVVAIYGIAAMFLPMSWFTALGYSDLHSLYVPGGPVAPFQQIEAIGLRRMQSTFSGPNQMGMWLLVPLSLSLTAIVRERTFARLLVCSLFAVSVLFSFSRAAWIAAAVIGAVIAWKHMPKKQLLVACLSGRQAGCWLLVAAVFAVVMLPNIFLRATSSAGHIERPLQALRIMKEHPFGLGLGTAGPVSNRFSATCVDVPVGSDITWAQPHPELCVFIDREQVHPTDRLCYCPLLPENWYLQIGVEMGWIGFALYLTLVVLLLQRLNKLRIENLELRINSSILNSQFSIFLGISIAALFLHAWEDSAVAYTVWMLIASSALVSGAEGSPLQSRAQGRTSNHPL